MTFPFVINYHPSSQLLLKTYFTLETLQNTQKRLPSYSPQVTGLCVQFFSLDQCVVINMHWKVLCFCRSHGSLISCVLMYSIYSGLFSRANLALCRMRICVSAKWAQIDSLFELLERETSHMVPCRILLEWGSQAAHHILCECGESLEWYFMETVSVLNFVAHFI